MDGGGADPRLPGSARNDVRLINRLGRNGLSCFAELVVCGSPSKVAGDHVVLGLDRCLLIADQLAGDERANNGVNDRDPALGKLAVALPEAGAYSVCETIPPVNHWNAQPACKRITVAAGMPMSPGTFINPEKQVYVPGPSGAR